MSPAERENQRPSDILQLQVTAKLATEGVDGHDDVYYAYFLYFFFTTEIYIEFVVLFTD